MDKNNRNFSESNPNPWTSSDIIHSDLLATKNLVYDVCGFDCSQPLLEAQNAEYGAYLVQIDSFSIRFRVAKITPTKVGQFVTLWQRSGDGTTQPYDVSDPVDFFVISTRNGNNFGQFVFPKHVLFEQKIVSNEGEGGKRAIRVYPPWDKPTSLQAQKTQKWQLKYFMEIPMNEPINCARAQMLYAPRSLK
ncbi:MepB family protein [Paenibacillus sp. SYP-B3998]|uniref:MepB family protein n=1 Tax=Paenibacillus sp. SYP-B3998 TaxID=2678564 RepID=A0A6G3ZUR4_9BACL|nr:MepB family protein [Paenibacillus sp. SYP-B3998]NEW05810.1 MepB family protein [Paenibacillus sp. SYP-B3998]